ncbi:hypothetical protein Plec18170_008335 [Paecilomyces lecythidis]
MATAKLIDKRFHNVPGKLRIAEMFFDVPVDYSKPLEGSIRLFARSVKRLVTSPEPEKEKKLPWFVYLQGGPGMGCRPPQEYGWIGTVLDKGYQLLFLDQRGTGLSSTITAKTLARQGNAVKQAEYLRHFRADNIVRDCEAVRKCLTADYPDEQKKWSVIGQSFGGFCAVTYLSKHPEGLREVFTTGGLAPLVDEPDPVYKLTYEKVLQRNEAYYAKYPEDVERVKKILEYLQQNNVALDSGRLTPRRFQQLGIMFGMHGGLDSIHDFPPFRIDAETPRVFFTGEMIYKDMFESYNELKELKDVADILATYDDWPALYDEEQLAKNEVPVYSATYVDDMYVHFDLARATASKIKGTKQFITNTMYHDGLRSKSDELMRELFSLKEDSID